MQIVTHSIDITTLYDIYSIFTKGNICFFDIETTGLSRQKNYIYLIGVVVQENNLYKTIQWFNDDGQSEKAIIKEFVEFVNKYQVLIHYNGTSFDIPFVKERAKKYGIIFNTDSIQSYDIYKIVLKYKKFLSLKDVKQKTIELFLHINRDDIYDGGTLIHIYQEYLVNQEKNSFDLLLLHNYEDLCGLVKITDILSYIDMAKGKFNVMNIRDCEEHIIIMCQLKNALKSSFSVMGEYFYLNAIDKEMRLLIKKEHMNLKYFYEDYKNYYYLPDEDMAIHKSVAQFVDKEHRKKATKDNCYTKKEGIFIRQDDNIFKPYFKKNYNDKTSYVLISDIFKNNQQLMDISDSNKNVYDIFKKYVEDILKKLSS